MNSSSSSTLVLLLLHHSALGKKISGQGPALYRRSSGGSWNLLQYGEQFRQSCFIHSVINQHSKKVHEERDFFFHEKPIKIQEFNYKDLESATSNFSQTKLLGRGSYELVYKGVLHGGRLVAVKKSSKTARRMLISENPNEFENEIDILSKLQSPSLVNLVGFSKSDSQDRRASVHGIKSTQI